MGSGKRASMREGPLSALFRNTEQEGTEKREVQDRPHDEPEAREPEAAAPEPVVPHPSLRRDVPEPPPEPEPRVRSPQERLRAAFSSELPDDILAPPPDRARVAPAPARATAPDPYAREDLAPPFAPGVGQPVIRVVGVGGAGVNAL